MGSRAISRLAFTMAAIAALCCIFIACALPQKALAAVAADSQAQNERLEAGLSLRDAAAKQKANAKSAKASADGACPVKVKPGLYKLRLVCSPNRSLTARSASQLHDCNLLVGKRSGRNTQKFAIRTVGKKYYRICSALGNLAVTVKKTGKKSGANIYMGAYRGSARQLWIPEKQKNGSIRFVNKGTGLVLTCASAKTGANVYQGLSGGAKTAKGRARAKMQGFKLVKTEVNLRDRASFVAVVKQAPDSSSLKLSNRVLGYSVNEKKWKNLVSAVRSCGFSLGFIMVDCSTGMTVSYNADRDFYGASTIKGLYATYLFEDKLETGKLSRGQISGLVRPTIVNSNNSTYWSLRASYGSQSGFNSWLSRVGVGPIGLWGTYDSRTLAKAWANMLAYSNSKGKHVGYWKDTFDHSYMSSIHDELAKGRITYSKPGWMFGGTYGTKLNDAGIVKDPRGRQYILSIMTSASPTGQKGSVQRVVRALDAIHGDMPAHR